MNAVKGILRKGFEKISTSTSVVDVGKGKDLSKMSHGKGFSKDIAVPAQKNPRLMEKITAPKPVDVGKGKELSKMIYGQGFSMKDVVIPPQKKPDFKELKKMAKPLLSIDYDLPTKKMSHELSAKSETFVKLENEVNKSLDKRVDKVINEGINFHKKKFGDGYHDPSFSVENISRVKLSNQKKLSVMRSPGEKPHYDPNLKKVVVNDSKWLDSLPHELEHARQDLSGELSLMKPEHRLWSEALAFRKQDIVSKEISGKSPKIFEGRTSIEMAKSYVGKKSYPGTLESSKLSVEKDRAAKGNKND